MDYADKRLLEIEKKIKDLDLQYRSVNESEVAEEEFELMIGHMLNAVEDLESLKIELGAIKNMVVKE